MIDQATFYAEWVVLEERFRVSHSDPIIHRYRTYLEAHLTDEQFSGACITIFNEDTFFPSPARFVQAVYGALEEQAAVEWSKLFAAHLKNERADVSPLARKAWNDIFAGGQLQADGSDQRASFVRRDFIQTYKALQTVGENPPGVLPAPTPAEYARMLETAGAVTKPGQNQVTRKGSA